MVVLDNADTTFVCAGCDRHVTSNTMTKSMLRAVTGYEHMDGLDWCPQCAAALLTVIYRSPDHS